MSILLNLDLAIFGIGGERTLATFRIYWRSQLFDVTFGGSLLSRGRYFRKFTVAFIIESSINGIDCHVKLEMLMKYLFLKKG